MHPCWTNAELESVIDGECSPPVLPSLPLPNLLPQPYSLACLHTYSLLYILISFLCPALPPTDISAEQLQDFIPQLLSAIYIEALIIGNISKEVS